MGRASFNIKNISYLSCLRRADALVDGTDGIVYFVEPHVERMTMKELLGRLGHGLMRMISEYVTSTDNLTGGVPCPGEVVYLQSQNDNLRQANSEFVGIQDDVPQDIAWATKALGTRQKPRCLNK